MARWRLTGPHYLMVPGTEWEYSEITRDGKQSRQRFQVPTYLDPAQPPSMNDPNGRNVEIVVCHEDKGLRGDITFVGDPTPDMVPMDEEAEKISAELSETKWKVAVDSLEGSFGAHLEKNLEKQLLAIRKDAIAQSQPLEGVQELLGAITQMMQQNQTLISMIAGAQAQPPKDIAPTEAHAQKVARRA